MRKKVMSNITPNSTLKMFIYTVETNYEAIISTFRNKAVMNISGVDVIVAARENNTVVLIANKNGKRIYDSKVTHFIKAFDELKKAIDKNGGIE